MAPKLKLKLNYNPSLLDSQQQSEFEGESPAMTNTREMVEKESYLAGIKAQAANEALKPQVKLGTNGGISGMLSKPGMAGAISTAGTQVGQAIDPQGTGMGTVLSGAAQGAATGTTIMPGYGTAIGAVIGAGLGMIQADNKRKEIKRQSAADAQTALAKGFENAAKVQFQFRGNNGRKLNL